MVPRLIRLACLHTWIALFLFAPGCSATQNGHKSESMYDLALQDVTVFNSQLKQIQPAQTILINADTIAAIVSEGTSFVARNTIDGKNRLVTPGFIDTHTHLNLILENEAQEWPGTLNPDSSAHYRSILTDQYLKYGTTTIVDMGQPEAWMDETLRWQQNPSPVYPDVFVGGGAMISDETRNTYMNHTEVMDPEDGKKKVALYAEKGVRHIKLYWRLREPEMRAITEEAKAKGILMFGHIDIQIVNIQTAMDLGVRHFEHFMTLPASTIRYNEHWDTLNRQYGVGRINNMDEYAAAMLYFFQLIKDTEEYDAQLEELLDRMAREGTSLSTTIHILGSTAERTPFFSSFEHFPEREAPEIGYSTETRLGLQEAFDTMMSYLKTAHDKGVTIRIGTDCKYGGRALLSEMMLLAEAGFPMEDILQIATWNGYKAMNLTDRYGTIEPGKQANLVIFSQNPFDDYTHVFSDKVVIKDGRIAE